MIFDVSNVGLCAPIQLVSPTLLQALIFMRLKQERIETTRVSLNVC